MFNFELNWSPFYRFTRFLINVLIGLRSQPSTASIATALAAASSEALPLSDLGAQELPPAGHEERDYRARLLRKVTADMCFNTFGQQSASQN